MKEVTILLAVKNGEKWLEKTLISVRNQTFKEYEFLIIDDGSTDLTKTIILKHKELDARIKYFYKKHSGLTESLNYGLGKASGKWIARLDADDIALPDRLNKQLSFVKNKKNTVLVGSNFFLQKNKIVNNKHYKPVSAIRFMRIQSGIGIHRKFISAIKKFLKYYFFRHLSSFPHITVLNIFLKN